MRDASDYVVPGLEEHPQANVAGYRFWQAPLPFRPDAKSAGEPIAVFANEGRWIAECPDCRGAQLASHADPRFMCVCCANVDNGGAFRPLHWPRNRAALEEVLHERPMVNQNWTPGETVSVIRAETKRMLSATRRPAVVGTGWPAEEPKRRAPVNAKKRKAVRS